MSDHSQERFRKRPRSSADLPFVHPAQLRAHGCRAPFCSGQACSPIPQRRGPRRRDGVFAQFGVDFARPDRRPPRRSASSRRATVGGQRGFGGQHPGGDPLLDRRLQRGGDLADPAVQHRPVAAAAPRMPTTHTVSSRPITPPATSPGDRQAGCQAGEQPADVSATPRPKPTPSSIISRVSSRRDFSGGAGHRRRQPPAAAAPARSSRVRSRRRRGAR